MSQVYNCDSVAETLQDLGALAYSMPPSFVGAGVSHPLRGPGGEWLGRMLPGVGVVVNASPKKLGLRRSIPGVLWRDTWLRSLDGQKLLLPVRGGAITTYDGIIASRGGSTNKANDVCVSKLSLVTVANTWSSLFQSAGLPGAGAYTSGAGATMNNATAGALSFGMTNPTGADLKYLLTFGYTAVQQINIAMLVDQLVGFGALSGSLNTSQTVGSPALTRYTSGAGVMLTFDVTVALGGTPSNITVSYTNQAGTAGQVTPAQAMTTSAIVQRLQPVTLGPFIQLAAGDFGVRAVASVTLSASMTAGTFAGILYFPLSFVPGVTGNIYAERDSTVQIDGLTQLAAEGGGALGCLNVFVFPNGASTGVMTAFMRTCAG
jgi:hypothetical protein